MIVLFLLLQRVLCNLNFEVERKLKAKKDNYNVLEYVFQTKTNSQNFTLFENMYPKYMQFQKEIQTFLDQSQYLSIEFEDLFINAKIKETNCKVPFLGIYSEEMLNHFVIKKDKITFQSIQDIYSVKKQNYQKQVYIETNNSQFYQQYSSLQYLNSKNQKLNLYVFCLFQEHNEQVYFDLVLQQTTSKSNSSIIPGKSVHQKEGIKFQILSQSLKKFQIQNINLLKQNKNNFHIQIQSDNQQYTLPIFEFQSKNQKNIILAEKQAFSDLENSMSEFFVYNYLNEDVNVKIKIKLLEKEDDDQIMYFIIVISVFILCPVFMELSRFSQISWGDIQQREFEIDCIKKVESQMRKSRAKQIQKQRSKSAGHEVDQNISAQTKQDYKKHNWNKLNLKSLLQQKKDIQAIQFERFR